MELSAKFEPRDLWVGLFWDIDKERDRLLLYFCFVPLLVVKIHVERNLLKYRFFAAMWRVANGDYLKLTADGWWWEPAHLENEFSAPWEQALLARKPSGFSADEVF